MCIAGKTKLIYPVTEADKSVKFYAADGELFDILHKTHVSVGHGGRDRMMKELQKQYKNVARPAVELYLQFCEACEKKRKGMKKGVVVKPLLFSEFNSRAQVDLIDFQSQPDGVFRFVLVYQDHLTKFVNLKALQRKRAKAVADKLIDIFTFMGAPSVLQSDNGREFVNRIIENLKQIWPELVIVHGKPRHSQSQGSVERANGDVKNMIYTWMTENKTTQWSKGLRFIQLMKNRAFHSGINRTPYEALFGCKLKLGLSTSFPSDVIGGVASEEDLEDVLSSRFSDDESPNNTDDESRNDTQQESHHDIENAVHNDAPTSGEEELCCVCLKGTVETCHQCRLPLHSTCVPTFERGGNSFSLCTLCIKREICMSERSSAKENLEHQAKKMRMNSDIKFPPANVGDTVRVPVPDVDKGPGDARNILAVVLEETDGFYKLGTKDGVLRQLYARSQFTVCRRKFVDIEDVPQQKVALRSVATSQAIGGRQGFMKCMCKGKCQNSRCCCLKKGVLCNSRCHNSLSCCNK